jgi:hypothetical protein
MKRLLLVGVWFWAGISALLASPADFQSKYFSLSLSRDTPAFASLVVDSLGQGKLGANPILGETNATGSVRFESPGPGKFIYRSAHGGTAWRIDCREKVITLESEFPGGEALPPLVLRFNQKLNHATLLGLMKPGERTMPLPCLLHLPDMGSVRITGDRPGMVLDYDARRYVKPPFVRVAFPAATAEHPRVRYRLEVAAIYPRLRGIENNPRYDGFRRDFLNIFQINPRAQMLANNAASDPVAFTVYEYAEVARQAPPLAKGLTCLDLIRMTLDRYLAGAKGYGQTGYISASSAADIIGWKTPYDALDSNPSLVISACHYIEGAKDWKWARANYAGIARWARTMLATGSDGNGLIEYPGSGNLGDRPTADRRPANWWDTINFGHEDAYANALAYRAATMLAKVARELGQKADASFFETRAAKLRASYLPTFLNPATGVLAGWRSQDGQLHDYWFTFVNGVAVTYGLLDAKDANLIMDRELSKLAQVGFTNFSLGLPGNLVPVRKGDYVLHNSPPTQFGEPQLGDGSDGFQFYENGGATGCFAYFTIKALYQLNRHADAERIFHPMLKGYAAGDFQGFCDDGMSKDWRDWNGGCHGYEGLLVDNYLTLLAVFDDLGAAKK